MEAREIQTAYEKTLFVLGGQAVGRAAVQFPLWGQDPTG